VDWTSLLTRGVLAVPRPIWRILFLPLRLVPSFRTAFQVCELVHELERLERTGAHADTRAFRAEALQTLDPSFSPPLWRAQGADLLRSGQAAEALTAFEQGIAHLGDRAMLYGVSRPAELYYGAAVAALQTGIATRRARTTDGWPA
jgi:hypothetical protein